MNSVFKALIQRLASTQQLDLIVATFYQTMAQDVVIGFFFDPTKIELIAHQQVQFLKFVAGLIQKFEGKAPKQAHQPLPPILLGHFNRRMMLLESTLQQFDLSQEESKAWLNFERGFQGALVQS